MMAELHENRIKTLDAFRCVAVLLVVTFHFCSRYTTPVENFNYYPYGDALAIYFQFGGFGVQLFFIISGFVILYTLERSKHIADFLFKRFVRLFPAILVCSVITYFFVEIFDKTYQFPIFHSASALNFIPSLTFSEPAIWIRIFHKKFDYVSGSYWSLWPEVVFYFSCSIIFFLNKKKFISNWFYLLTPTMIFKILVFYRMKPFVYNAPVLNVIVEKWGQLGLYCNFVNYMIYFSFGIFFYYIFSRKVIPVAATVICIVFALAELYLIEKTWMRIFLVCTLMIFSIFVYKPAAFSFLNNRLVIRIGVISYGIYLIHEFVGVILISKLGSLVQSPFLQKVVPVFVLFICIGFAEFMYRFYETPVMRFLKKKLLQHHPEKMMKAT